VVHSVNDFPVRLWVPLLPHLPHPLPKNSSTKPYPSKCSSVFLCHSFWVKLIPSPLWHPHSGFQGSAEMLPAPAPGKIDQFSWRVLSFYFYFILLHSVVFMWVSEVSAFPSLIPQSWNDYQPTKEHWGLDLDLPLKSWVSLSYMGKEMNIY
jgi:hypothetical protein